MDWADVLQYHFHLLNDWNAWHDEIFEKLSIFGEMEGGKKDKFSHCFWRISGKNHNKIATC